ncbi:MAG: DUF935 family protein [Kiritimatiellae bacterium]|nr:DUF935 family protein [Kiritimatiellia bacterium]
MATKRKTVTNVAAVPPVLGGSASTPTPMPSVQNPKTGRRLIVPSVSGGSVKSAAQSEFLKSIVARLNSHLHKSTVGWMHDTINPLFNITSRQAQMIYDFARSGNFAQLEYLYNEIENCSPVFNVCVTRRCSALSELDWQVVQSDQRLNRNADAALVKEQIECVETAIAKIDNLPDALEHFALAAFRGFSIVSVWRGADGMPTHLECLDQWNVCRDYRNNKWLWNPGAVSFMNPTLGQCKLDEIPKEDSVAVTRKRQIDWPAMKIFLRESIGERDWGRFLETYGLPPVIITMPEFTSKEDQEAYVEAAAAVFEGRSGVIPHDSEVNFASESRGVNPFTEFIEHQMKLFVLMATGGTLTSLSEAGSGTLAGNAQMDVWRQIVRADVRIVSNAINKQLCEGIIKSCKDFEDKPVLAEFRLNPEPQMTADQILDLAGKAANAGLELDEKEISQICGFTVRRKHEGGMGFNAEPPPPPHTPPAPDGGTSLSDPGVVTQIGPTGEVVHKADAAPEVAENADTGAEAAKPPSAASEPVGGTVLPPEPPTHPAPSLAAAEKADAVTPQAEKIGERLVRSLQKDFKEVADGLARVLALPEDDRAGAAAKLLAKLDSLVPDDPAMAEVIAEQMQEAFDLQLKRQPEGDAPAANKAIPN